MKTLRDQLKEWQRQNQPAKRNRKDELTVRDVRELMGMNRPTYRRKRGALRQK